MLTATVPSVATTLGHGGAPVAPHDLAAAWNLEPVLLAVLGLSVWAYWRGTRRRLDRWRAACFAGGIVALVVALVSPLEAMAGALASAHMVQHLLLVLAAAPLLACSAPAGVLLRGAPVAVREASGRWRRRIGLRRDHVALVRHPVVAWLLYVATLWSWHAAGPYDAALTHEAVHILEHSTFLVTAWAFWRVVIGAHAGVRVSHGAGILLVFGVVLQGVFLSMLLTFARTPWYEGYATTTAAWGLDPLADQQLAGVIMWIPSSAVYIGIALSLLLSWLRSIDRLALPVTTRTPADSR